MWGFTKIYYQMVIYMLVFLYSLVAAFFTGFHIFSLKYLESVKDNTHLVLSGVVLLAIISRYSIYHAMKYTDNPTIVHLFLNFSTFITFFLSMWFFKINNFDLTYFLSGMILVSIGFFLINQSYCIVKKSTL